MAILILGICSVHSCWAKVDYSIDWFCCDNCEMVELDMRSRTLIMAPDTTNRMENTPEHEAKWHPLTAAAAAVMWKTNVCTFSGRTRTLKQRWRTMIAAAAIRHSIYYSVGAQQNLVDEKRPFQYGIFLNSQFMNSKSTHPLHFARRQFSPIVTQTAAHVCMVPTIRHLTPINCWSYFDFSFCK